MQAINRWRNWKPQDEKFHERPRGELTELTKPASVSFVSAIPGRIQNFSDAENLPEPSPRAETLAEVELLPAEVREWDDALLVWAKTCRAFRERSWGSLMRLYVDHTKHAHKTGGLFAPDIETFRAILLALGFAAEDGWVYGLVLKEDAEAACWRPEPRRSALRNRGGQ